MSSPEGGQQGPEGLVPFVPIVLPGTELHREISEALIDPSTTFEELDIDLGDDAEVGRLDTGTEREEQ